MSNEDKLRTLLKRIREWDHLDFAADGPHWKREIDEALAATQEPAHFDGEAALVGWARQHGGGK